MPKWTIARLKDKPIAIQFLLPIKFVLDDSSLPSTNPTKFETRNNSEKLSFLPKVFPNPTKGLINIELQGNNTVSYFLTDLNGKTIFEGQFSDNINNLDLSGQLNGVYSLTLINLVDKQKQIIKIIKTN